MKIRELMRPGAFTIGAADWLGNAYTTMNRGHVRHLPVLEHDKMVGMLSERDVLAARARIGGDWWTAPVRVAMHAPVQTAHPDDSLTEAAARMAQAQLGALPVVEGGKLVGIATVADVLHAEVRDAMALVPRAVAADIMTPYPVTVRPESTLADAVVVMTDRHVRHLPVVDASSSVVGMVSERDVRTAIGDPVSYRDEADASPAQLRVKDVMTRPVVTVPFDRSVDDLARRFVDDRIGAVPVVDTFGALIGIVSYIDVLRAFPR